MTKKSPRGILNANPGNIRIGAKWQGLCRSQIDQSFCQFENPSWGIRALAVTLITYQDKYGINTIRNVINRWAPPIENDTSSYVDSVAAMAGRSPDSVLDLHNYYHLRPIVEGIILHENGRGPLKARNSWYSDAVIDAALARAGVVKPAIVMDAMPVTKETVGATATATVGAAQLVDVAPQMMLAMESSQDQLSSGSIVRIALGVVTIGLAVYIAWAQIKKHQNGVVA